MIPLRASANQSCYLHAGTESGQKWTFSFYTENMVSTYCYTDKTMIEFRVIRKLCRYLWQPTVGTHSWYTETFGKFLVSFRFKILYHREFSFRDLGIRPWATRPCWIPNCQFLSNAQMEIWKLSSPSFQGQHRASVAHHLVRPNFNASVTSSQGAKVSQGFCINTVCPGAKIRRYRFDEIHERNKVRV